MAKANAGSFNADTNLDLHINVDDGQLVELVKTLKTLSQGNDLKQYWKNVDAAIQSAQRSALQYKKNINSTFNAKDFVKNYNALKAITQKDTISDLFPDIDNIDTLFESAKKLVPDIASQFSSKTFSQVFQTLESLESKGLELDDVFKKLQRYNSLEKEVRGLRQENFEFRDLIGDEDIEKLKSYKNEVMKLREEYKVTFSNFLLSHNISPTDDYGYLNFEDYFQSIEKGTLTASEAIQKFKNNEKALLESKFELNDDTFNVDYFQEFSNKLEQIFSRVEDIYRNLDEVITNGIITKNGDGSSFPLFDDILENEEKFQSLITLIQKVKEGLNVPNKSDNSSGNADAEKQNLEEIRSATEAAVQAKKEFASANGDVKASANGSKSPLQLESELMQQIAKSAREAANAKKEFVDANGKVQSSSNDSGLKLETSTNQSKKLDESIHNIEQSTNQAESSLSSYTEKWKILSQVGEATDDSYSATFEKNKGQIEVVKWKVQKDEDGNYIYDSDGNKEYSMLSSTISNYQKLEKTIVDADNALRKLETDKAKILSLDENSSTTYIDTQIQDQKEYIQLLEQTIDYIANLKNEVIKEDGSISLENAYLIDTNAIKEARAKAEREYTLNIGAKNEMSSAKQSAAQSAADEKKRIADEKKRLANIEQVNRSLNKQQIHIDSIEKSYNKSINKDLDRAVTNQNDLTELNNKKTEIQNLINKLKDTPRDNTNENEFLQLERLINEYKELSKYKLKANNPSKQELGGQKLEVLVQQQISAYDKLILKAQSYGEEAKDVLKILQDQRGILAKQDDNGKFIATADEYYTARDNLKVESAIFSVFEAEEKSLNKAWEEAKKVNDALNETQNILSKLPEESKKGLESTQYNELENKITKLNDELKSGKKTVSDYKKEVASLTSDYSKNFNDKENKVYDELTNTIKEYEQVKKRIANNQALDGDVQAAADLSDKIQQLQTSPILSQEHLNSSEKQLEKIKKDIELIEKKRAKQDTDKKNAALKETENSLSELPRTKELDSQFSDLEKKVASLNEELKTGKKTIEEYKSEIKSLTSDYSKGFNEKEAETFKDLTNTLKEYKAVKTRIAKGQALDGDVQLASQLEDKILDIQDNPILSQKHLNESVNMLNNIYRELDVIDQKTEKMRNKAISKANDSKKEQLERLKKAVTDYSDGDTTEANAKIKELEDNLARNFSRLIPTDSIDKVITQLKKEVDSIIGNLKKSSSENQKAEESKKKSEAKAIETEWKDAVKALNEYEEAQTRLNTLKAQNTDGSKKNEIADQEQKIKSLQASYESARQTIASFFTSVDKHRALLNFASQSDIDDTIERLGTAAEGSSRSISHLNDEMEKASKKRLDGVENTLKSFQSTADKLAIRPDGQHSFASWTNQLTTLNTLVKEFDDKVNALRQKDFVSEDDINNLKALEDKIKSTIATMNKVPQAQRGFSDISVAKAIEKINKILQDNTRYSQAAKDGLKALIKELETSPKMPVEKYLESAFKIQRNERAMGREGKSLGSILKDKVLYGFAGQLAGMFGIYDVINIGKQAFGVIKDLDSALTEMRKVSDETTTSLKNFQQASFDMAQQVGVTALEIQNSISDFMKLGYSLDEASKLSEDANIYANVGDMEIDEATEHMISSIQAWKSEFSTVTEASTNIIDRYNEIGNRFAITSADIGSAMERSAAALKAGGNTLNESIGIITAGNLIQQDADTTANAIKVLSLRIRGSKSELEQMGEETDNLASSTSKLRSEIKALTGVDIMENDKTYKSTAKIIQEIGAVFNKLDDVSQAATLELLAGKTRASTVAGLLENYQTIGEVMKVAEQSENSAREENEKYMDSMEGRINILQSQLQELAFASFNSDTAKNAISFLTTILDLVTNIVDTIGIVPTILPALGGILGQKTGLGKNAMPLFIR